MARHCVLCELPKDGVLFFEGGACSRSLTCQSSTLKLFKMAENGREQVASVERAGSTVGALSLFDGGNFPAPPADVEGSNLCLEETN